MPNTNYQRKWIRQDDGLFHCNHPGCTYTHDRAASMGRHTVVHSGKPYAKNTKAEIVKANQQASREDRKRDYAREYYLRYKANQQKAKATATVEEVHKLTPHKPTKEISHVNGSNPHPEIERTRYLLAGGFLKEIQSAARALNCSEADLTSGIIPILRAATVR